MRVMGAAAGTASTVLIQEASVAGQRHAANISYRHEADRLVMKEAEWRKDFRW
jgi:hypothetical protein